MDILSGKMYHYLENKFMMHFLFEFEELDVIIWPTVINGGCNYSFIGTSTKSSWLDWFGEWTTLVIRQFFTQFIIYDS